MSECINTNNPGCGVKNPLIRTGTNQDERLPLTLIPENIKIDDRKTEDLLLYLYNYAGQLKYFDLSNRHKGSWQPFFDFDKEGFLMLEASRNLLIVEKQYLELVDQYNEKLRNFNDQEEQSLEKIHLVHFRKILNFIFQKLLYEINTVYLKVPQDHPLEIDLENFIKEEIVGAVINNRIENALIKLIGFEKGNIAKGDDAKNLNDYSAYVFNENSISENTEAEVNQEIIRKRIKTWGIDQICYDCITADTTIGHEGLEELFRIFFKVLTLIQEKAKFYFDLSLNQKRAHLPHMTMLLTFIQLFKEVQGGLNNLTLRHLKYYYERVLCLNRKKGKSDQVHLVFELAKNFDNHVLPKGLSVLGGKDSKGKNLVYQTQNELVVTKAQIAEVKTVFVNEKAFSNSEYLRVYNAPFAQKLDGFEVDFDKPENVKWSALGNIFHSPNVRMPNAEIGFSIASPILFLREGHRQLKMIFQFEKSVLPQHLIPEEGEEIGETFREKGQRSGYYEGKFKVMLSVEEDWMPLVERPENALLEELEEAPGYFTVRVLENPNNPDVGLEDYSSIEFEFELDKTFPALAPFPGKAPEIPFNTKWPMVKIVLQNEHSDNNYNDLQNSLYPYAILRDIPVIDCRIDVDVKDVRNLVLHNDISVLDPNKEFFPFGPLPNTGHPGAKGSSLFIGSQEVFSKKIDHFNINIEWGDLPKTPPESVTSTGLDAFEYYYKEYQQALNLGQIRPRREVAAPDDEHAIAPKNKDFKVKPYLLRGKNYELLGASGFVENEIELFVEPGSNELQAQRKIEFGSGRFNLEEFDRNPALIFEDNFHPSNSTAGFLKLELTGGDFLHASYNKVLAKISHHNAKADFREESNLTPIEFPNEPFIPTIKSLSLDYKSTQRLQLSGFGAFKQSTGGVEELYHLTPFGHKKMDVFFETNAQNKEGIAFLPPFKQPYLSIPTNINPLTIKTRICEVESNQEGENGTFSLGENPPSAANTLIPDLVTKKSNLDGLTKGFKPKDIKVLLDKVREPLADGNLYLGIKDLKPQESVSIFFQVVEGSGNNEYAPPGIKWSFLQDNEWVEFTPNQILANTTNPDPGSNYSLLKSGIVKFMIPKDISNKNTTILNPAFHWVRASTIPSNVPSELLESPAALPYLVSIRTQAVTAIFVDQDNSLDHLTTALPANTISKLAISRSAIKKVEQPYSSFGGRVLEEDREYFKRVQEHLRHKGRGINAWDVERIILEEFPGIFKVKCLNHSSYKSEIHPGHITVGVIPNIRNNNNINPLEPRVHLGELLRIERFLRTTTNLFVACNQKLKVINPSYEEIRVVCEVIFKPGKDVAYYQARLNEDIKRFLAPWGYLEELENLTTLPEIAFGNHVHRSHVMNFVEEREYIHAITRFALLHYDRFGKLVPYYDTEGKQLAPEHLEEVISTTSLSVLTSYQKRNEGETINYAYDHIILTKTTANLASVNNNCGSC